MLNTNNTSAQSHDINNILHAAKLEVVEVPKNGQVFTSDNFAKSWNSIYVNGGWIEDGTVSIGMREVKEPTLLLTTDGKHMAYLLPNILNPIYIPSNFKEGEEGYIMAFTLSSEALTPEYIYYMCLHDLWKHYFAASFNEGDGFENTGFTGDTFIGADNQPHEIWITPESILLNASPISLPTLGAQGRLVEESKDQQSAPDYDLKELVARYLNQVRTKNIFSKSGIGLLVECYKAAMKSLHKECDSRILEALQEYKYTKGILSESEIAFLADHIEDVFDMVVKPDEQIHQGGEGFLQPKEVTDFVLKLAEFPKDIVVYNPFAGAASYATSLPNKVVGEEINPITWALAQIRLSGVNNYFIDSDVKLGDSFQAMADDRKYKAIVSSPAYLREKGHRIFDIVETLYNKLEDNGKMAILVPGAFLFSSSPSERSIRDRLISDRAIKAVIELPRTVFAYTSIPQYLIIANKGEQNDSILFADASGYTRYDKSIYKATMFDGDQFLKELEDEVDEYYDRDCVIDDTTIGAPIPYSSVDAADLTPSRYLTPKPKNGIALSTMASKVIGRAKHDETATYFIIGSSIPVAMHRKPFVPSTVNDGKVSSAKSHAELSGSNVIVGLVNGKVRTAYTENLNGIMAFPSDFVMVLKPNEGVSAKYLAAVLSTPEVTRQIAANARGTIIPRMGKVDLSDIIVPNHDTPESREQLISEVISSEMSDLETELQEAFENHKREVRSTRHAMIQTLSALSSNWEQLNLFSQLNGGTLKMSDTIGRINPITVETLMGSIAHSIKTLQNQVESLRYERADWGKEVEINPVEFINTYIDTHSCPEVKMEVVERNNSADFPWIDEETGETQMLHTDSLDVFYAPKRLVERIFNNIVSNAKAHGFANKEGGHIIRFQWEMEGDYLVIRIANNGAPLKLGVSENDVLMNGFSTSLNVENEDGTFHSGHGGFEIKSLMEGLGSVEVISLPDDEFPVIYKLTFEKTNTVAL